MNPEENDVFFIDDEAAAEKTQAGESYDFVLDDEAQVDADVVMSTESANIIDGFDDDDEFDFDDESTDNSQADVSATDNTTASTVDKNLLATRSIEDLESSATPDEASVFAEEVETEAAVFADESVFVEESVFAEDVPDIEVTDESAVLVDEQTEHDQAVLMEETASELLKADIAPIEQADSVVAMSPVAALDDVDNLSAAISQDLSQQQLTQQDASLSQNILAAAKGEQLFDVPEISRQGFYIGELALMVEFVDGNELTDLPRMYRLPNTPSWLKGYVNLHGNLIPVFDLNDYFQVAVTDTSPRKAKDAKLLVLLQGDDAAGIIIDKTPSRLRLPTDQKGSIDIAPTKLQPHVLEAYKHHDEIWFDLNVNSLFDTLEREIQG